MLVLFSVGFWFPCRPLCLCSQRKKENLWFLFSACFVLLLSCFPCSFASVSGGCNWDRRRWWRWNFYAQSLVTETDEDVRLLVINAPFFNSAPVLFYLCFSLVVLLYGSSVFLRSLFCSSRCLFLLVSSVQWLLKMELWSCCFWRRRKQWWRWWWLLSTALLCLPSVFPLLRTSTMVMKMLGAVGWMEGCSPLFFHMLLRSLFCNSASSLVKSMEVLLLSGFLEAEELLNMVKRCWKPILCLPFSPVLSPLFPWEETEETKSGFFVSFPVSLSAFFFLPVSLDLYSRFCVFFPWVYPPRSLIFSGFIAREYQPFETASRPLLPETAPEEEGEEGDEQCCV